jgi:hypothetical protein
MTEILVMYGLAVLPIDGEPQIIAGNIDFGASFFRWTADGRALAYVLTRRPVLTIAFSRLSPRRTWR